MKTDPRRAANALPTKVEQSHFGTLPDGRAVRRYTLRNRTVEVELVEYGAIVTALRTPDDRGRIGDVVLGFDALEGYLDRSPYFGAVVGRYANRIAHGRFTLDGETYQLACNDGGNHLHGGVRGFDKVLWNGAPASDGGMPGVTFTHVSAEPTSWRRCPVVCKWRSRCSTPP